jgi:hypothetical protein
MVKREYFSERKMSISDKEKFSKLVEITRKFLKGINIVETSVSFDIFRGTRRICQVNPYAMRIDAYNEEGSEQARQLALAYENVFGKDSFTLRDRFSRSILK